MITNITIIPQSSSFYNIFYIKRRQPLQVTGVRRRRFPKHIRRIEAGTLLDPFSGFYLAITVQVRTEVAMTAEAGVGIIPQQQHNEHAQGMFLKRGAGIGGTTLFV